MIPNKRWSTMRKLMVLGKMAVPPAVEDTATGNPLTFGTDLAKPLKSLVANFLPIQSGTGDPSPTNIRPITGWTGLDVWHGGKNLLNPSLFSSASENYSVFDDVVTVKKSDDRAWGSVSEYELPAGRYTISRSNVQGRMTIKSSTDNYDVAIVNTLDASATFTLSQKCAIKIKLSGSTATYPYDTTLQIEVGQTATTYEPYSGTVYPVAWSTHGTIYGGYVDLVTGEVWATWIGETFSNLDLYYTTYKNANAFRTKELTGIAKKSGSTDFYLVSCFAKSGNITSYAESENKPNNSAYLNTSEDKLFIKATDYTTVSDFLEAYGIQMIVYKISTHVLITTLTPQQINALIGNNTIWSDGNGDCEVTYLKKG